MRLPAHAYVIRIKEMEAGAARSGPASCWPWTRGAAGRAARRAHARAGLRPARHLGRRGLREEATFRGCTVVDPATVLDHAPDRDRQGEHAGPALLRRDAEAAEGAAGRSRRSWSADLVPAGSPTGGIQRVLQALLGERVSIRDLPAILEGIGEARASTPSLVVDRRAGARPPGPPALLRQHAATDGAHADRHAVAANGSRPSPRRWSARARTGSWPWRRRGCRSSSRGVRETFEAAALRGETPVLLTSPAIRPYVRSIIERFRPRPGDDPERDPPARPASARWARSEPCACAPSTPAAWPRPCASSAPSWARTSSSSPRARRRTGSR